MLNMFTTDTAHRKPASVEELLSETLAIDVMCVSAFGVTSIAMFAEDLNACHPVGEQVDYSQN